MEEDGTQMEGSHSVRRLGFVCVCVRVLAGEANDRLICAYQQRRRWEAYSCFLKGARIIVYHQTPE